MATIAACNHATQAYCLALHATVPVDTCTQVTMRQWDAIKGKEEQEQGQRNAALPVCDMTTSVFASHRPCRVDWSYVCGNVTGADCSILMGRAIKHHAACEEYRGLAVGALSYRRSHQSLLFAEDSYVGYPHPGWSAESIVALVRAAYSDQWKDEQQFLAAAFKNCLDGHLF
jgi:hypothetical protein